MGILRTLASLISFWWNKVFFVKFIVLKKHEYEQCPHLHTIINKWTPLFSQKLNEWWKIWLCFYRSGGKHGSAYSMVARTGLVEYIEAFITLAVVMATGIMDLDPTETKTMMFVILNTTTGAMLKNMTSVSYETIN